MEVRSKLKRALVLECPNAVGGWQAGGMSLTLRSRLVSVGATGLDVEAGAQRLRIQVSVHSSTRSGSPSLFPEPASGTRPAIIRRRRVRKCACPSMLHFLLRLRCGSGDSISVRQCKRPVTSSPVAPTYACRDRSADACHPPATRPPSTAQAAIQCLLTRSVLPASKARDSKEPYLAGAGLVATHRPVL